MAGQDVDWDEVQGIVLSAYWEKPYTRYFLLTIKNVRRTRAWLQNEIGKTVSFRDDRSPGGASLNIAFTLSGLTKLGLPKAALDTFPWDFRDGMTSSLRSRILADRGHNAPGEWEWGQPVRNAKDTEGKDSWSSDASIDVLVMLYAREDELVRLEGELKTRLGSALQEIHRKIPAAEKLRERLDVGYRPDDLHEHFGFADGLSQPAIETSPRSRKFRERGELNAIIRSGEFILGYVNERGQLPVSPSVAMAWGSRLPVITRADHTMSGHWPDTTFPRLDFGRNGTFLVYRQLDQDVSAFDKLIKDAAAALGEDSLPRLSDETDFRKWLAAKFIGRWDDGTPLTLEPKKPPPPGGNLRTVNNFGYAAEDGYGLRCPIGAHIRRANPRDTLDQDPKHAIHRANRHRLLRRGRLYGPQTKWKAWDDEPRDKPKDGQSITRGLHFVAINASLESQFEFVQQQWMNTPFFGDLTGEFDPLLGTPEGANTPRHFTIQGAPMNRRVQWTKPLVRVRGGAYFFLPSKAALELLANDQVMAAIQDDKPSSAAKRIQSSIP